ncbi:MAG: carboxymuconolactone decarboxylase family protein [Rhodospirillaceae bacterium]|nr:carboxymuconolactone decarboxylase family protein [Rhodospirillaceae bacterium]
MARLTPLRPDQLSGLEDVFSVTQQRSGYVLNSYATVAHNPKVLRGVNAMSQAIMSPGAIDIELKRLVGYVSGNAAGCRFCQGHRVHGAKRAGVAIEKLKAAFEYETNPMFSPAERAAMRLAQHASVQPNAATDADFDDVKKYFTTEQIIEIMGVVALFGFWNRWNDTIKTEMESSPQAFLKKYFPELV